MSSFSLIKWNPLASTDSCKKRGILLEGEEGSYWVGVRFTSDKPGFVVQKITKKITKNGRTTYPSDYWEIFYIGGRGGMSRNADLFSQKGLGPRSKGKIIQKGYASFFPYDEEVKFTKDKDMKLTDDLKDIFGPDITMNGVPEAAGLPSGFKPPLMKTLTKGPICIIHKVKMEWTPHDATLTEEVIKRKKGGLEEIVDMNRPEGWCRGDEAVETAGIREGW